MKNAIAGLFLFLASLSPALAQQVVPPADTANCAFNTSPPTIASGNMIRIQCDAQGRLILSSSTTLGLLNPQVLSTPQSYIPGSLQPVGLDIQGGLIPATGLRVSPVSCASACTTFNNGTPGSSANGVLWTTSTWPYNTISVDITSAAVATTVTYEISNDSPGNCAASTTWTGISGNISSSVSIIRVATSGAAGIYIFNAGPAACFRARVSAYSSGTITVGGYLTNNPPESKTATINGAAGASTPAGAAQAVPVSVNPYPAGSIAITASNTGTTGATTATLAASATLHTYVCGFTITADATTALAGVATVTGTVTGTLNYIQNVGSATSAGSLTQTFSPCIPSSAINTSIAINSVAAGVAGNTAVTAWGFQL